jgi:hypothetical protein
VSSRAVAWPRPATFAAAVQSLAVEACKALIGVDADKAEAMAAQHRRQVHERANALPKGSSRNNSVRMPSGNWSIMGVSSLSVAHKSPDISSAIQRCSRQRTKHLC